MVTAMTTAEQGTELIRRLDGHDLYLGHLVLDSNFGDWLFRMNIASIFYREKV